MYSYKAEGTGGWCANCVGILYTVKTDIRDNIWSRRKKGAVNTKRRRGGLGNDRVGGCRGEKHLEDRSSKCRGEKVYIKKRRFQI